jgi:hypothetical protein
METKRRFKPKTYAASIDPTDDDGSYLDRETVEWLEEINESNRALILAEEQLYGIVGQARDNRVKWSLIGRVLGVSAQAAQQRFSKPPTGRMF